MARRVRAERRAWSLSATRLPRKETNMTDTSPDPIDPDAHLFTDATEGTVDGVPVPSVDGSELLAGGEE
jgi:hypothetical protein